MARTSFAEAAVLADVLDDRLRVFRV